MMYSLSPCNNKFPELFHIECPEDSMIYERTDNNNDISCHITNQVDKNNNFNFVTNTEINCKYDKVNEIKQPTTKNEFAINEESHKFKNYQVSDHKNVGYKKAVEVSNINLKFKNALPVLPLVTDQTVETLDATNQTVETLDSGIEVEINSANITEIQSRVDNLNDYAIKFTKTQSLSICNHIDKNDKVETLPRRANSFDQSSFDNILNEFKEIFLHERGPVDGQPIDSDEDLSKKFFKPSSSYTANLHFDAPFNNTTKNLDIPNQTFFQNQLTSNYDTNREKIFCQYSLKNNLPLLSVQKNCLINDSAERSQTLAEVLQQNGQHFETERLSLVRLIDLNKSLYDEFGQKIGPNPMFGKLGGNYLKDSLKHTDEFLKQYSLNSTNNLTNSKDWIRSSLQEPFNIIDSKIDNMPNTSSKQPIKSSISNINNNANVGYYTDSLNSSLKSIEEILFSGQNLSQKEKIKQKNILLEIISDYKDGTNLANKLSVSEDESFGELYEDISDLLGQSSAVLNNKHLQIFNGLNGTPFCSNAGFDNFNSSNMIFKDINIQNNSTYNNVSTNIIPISNMLATNSLNNNLVTQNYTQANNMKIPQGHLLMPHFESLTSTSEDSIINNETIENFIRNIDQSQLEELLNNVSNNKNDNNENEKVNNYSDKNNVLRNYCKDSFFNDKLILEKDVNFLPNIIYSNNEGTVPNLNVNLNHFPTINIAQNGTIDNLASFNHLNDAMQYKTKENNQQLYHNVLIQDNNYINTTDLNQANISNSISTDNINYTSLNMNDGSKLNYNQPIRNDLILNNYNLSYDTLNLEHLDVLTTMNNYNNHLQSLYTQPSISYGTNFLDDYSNQFDLTKPINYHLNKNPSTDLFLNLAENIQNSNPPVNHNYKRLDDALNFTCAAEIKSPENCVKQLTQNTLQKYIETTVILSQICQPNVPNAKCSYTNTKLVTSCLNIQDKGANNALGVNTQNLQSKQAAKELPEVIPARPVIPVMLESISDESWSLETDAININLNIPNLKELRRKEDGKEAVISSRALPKHPNNRAAVTKRKCSNNIKLCKDSEANTKNCVEVDDSNILLHLPLAAKTKLKNISQIIPSPSSDALSFECLMSYDLSPTNQVIKHSRKHSNESLNYSSTSQDQDFDFSPTSKLSGDSLNIPTFPPGQKVELFLVGQNDFMADIHLDVDNQLLKNEETKEIMRDCILTKQNEDGDGWLHSAVIGKNVYLVSGLLEKMKEENILNYIIDLPNNLHQTAFALAIITNQLNMVKLLLAAGANPNVCLLRNRNPNCFNYPLHLVASRGVGSTEILKVLLKDKRLLINALDSLGRSALICSIEAHDDSTNNNITNIQLLIEKGISLFRSNCGYDRTALYQAVLKRSLPICIAIIAGVSHRTLSTDNHTSSFTLRQLLDAKTVHGDTALHLAVTRLGSAAKEEDFISQRRIVQLLLANGIDPSIRNVDGKLAREITNDKRLKDLLTLKNRNTVM